MRGRKQLLVGLMSLFLMSVTVSTVFAGTQSSPDIDDDTGDWQVSGDPTGEIGNNSPAGGPVADATDINAVWWDFTSRDTLILGVQVVSYEPQDTMGEDVGSLSYAFEYTFDRPALPGADATTSSGLTATITTTLAAGSEANCEGGVNATKSPSDNVLTCEVASSSVAPEYQGNTTFFDGDAITSGSLSSEGSAGELTFTDSASGMDSPSTAEGVQPQPTSTEDGDAGGGGNGGNGDGGGGNGGGGGDGGESTPGFGMVVALAALVGVAIWASRRRD